MQSFLGDASHELRTPLTVVRGYFELLSLNPAFQGETERRYLQRIGSEIARMEILISDLLLLTETGNQPLPVLNDVNTSILVHQFVDDLRALNPDRRIIGEIADGLMVRGSEPLLAQMCANVYRNIAVHVPASALVRVALFERDEQAVLTIDDGGPGLSTDMYAAGIHAFQRFDPSRARETGGSGLGMSIIAAIVGQHGGQIALSPSDLGGLRTTISLPMRQQAGVEQ
jgi:signal transduction histidine kinase